MSHFPARFRGWETRRQLDCLFGDSSVKLTSFSLSRSAWKFQETSWIISLLLICSRVIVGLHPSPPVVANSLIPAIISLQELLLTFQCVSQIFSDGLNPGESFFFSSPWNSFKSFRINESYKLKKHCICLSLLLPGWCLLPWSSSSWGPSHSASYLPDSPKGTGTLVIHPVPLSMPVNRAQLSRSVKQSSLHVLVSFRISMGCDVRCWRPDPCSLLEKWGHGKIGFFLQGNGAELGYRAELYQAPWLCLLPAISRLSFHGSVSWLQCWTKREMSFTWETFWVCSDITLLFQDSFRCWLPMPNVEAVGLWELNHLTHSGPHKDKKKEGSHVVSYFFHGLREHVCNDVLEGPGKPILA